MVVDIEPIRGILLLMTDTKMLSLSDVIRIRSSPSCGTIMRRFFESLFLLSLLESDEVLSRIQQNPSLDQNGAQFGV